jgi:regulator of sigma E protease
MDIWIKAAQFILSLSLLVILHEFGHFIPAKLFKTRVEKFYLFFNPWFSLFKKKVGDTEWGIGWLPLGGFVKISGMVDESMDKDQLAQPAQPWEFRSKPAWQRLIIMLGGIFVNVVVGFVIYICVVFYFGVERLEPSTLKKGVAIHSYVEKYGLKSGDYILAVDGKPTKNVLEITNQVMFRGARDIQVKHVDGKISTIHLPENIGNELFENSAFPLVSLRSSSTTVDSIVPKSNAYKAKLQKGDKFLAINGNSIAYFDELQKQLYLNKAKTTIAKIVRGKDTIDVKIKVTKEGTLGFITSQNFIDFKSIKQYKPGLVESASLGIDLAVNTLGDYIGQFKYMFTKKGASSLGGFATMGNMFPSTWDWEIFWMRTAWISLALAIMNLLPIPALDGGHVVFLLYEMITGKEAPQKVLEVAQYVGIVLLLSLMLYANGNDVYRIFFK